MSRNGSIDLDWGDDTHRFRLAIGELRDLQEKCGASPFTVLGRVMSVEPMIDDLREVLRLGLIGGGLAPPQALVLVRRWVDERPLVESILPARAVLAAALYGVEDEPPGKAAGATETPNSSPPTAASAS